MEKVGEKTHIGVVVISAGVAGTESPVGLLAFGFDVILTDANHR